MNNILFKFINDTENAEYNFDLAQWYESHGYTAAGLTFYLRAAERFEDKLKSYHSLLKCFQCYDSQGSRDDSAKVLLQNAIALYPSRPEAYFLLAKFYEKYQQWQDCYIYSCIGLDCTINDENNSLLNIGYPGKYALLFYKAISGYRWGKGEESRLLFQELINNYNLDEPYYSIVVEYIKNLGSGPARSVFKQYKKDEHYRRLKYKFDTCENIENNYSQVYQDMFILYLLNGKTDGSYLEIGSGDPFWMNNTYLLENKYGWKGLGIDLNNEMVDKYRNYRKNPVLLSDAHNINYKELLSQYFTNTNIIDYLQLDCDPAQSTYELLLSIPFDEYKFRIITYEHDYYNDISRSFKQKSREYLANKGYKLVVSNVAPNSWASFEDWWVHPDLIDSNRIRYIQNDDESIKQMDKYFLADKPIFNCSTKNKTAIIIDNFYDDPDSVRTFALSQKFMDGGFGKGYIGKRTYEQFLFDGLKEKFEDILGQKINSWTDQPMNGRFQITYAGEPLVYHCDSQKWAAMIYLTPNAPFECGTSLYAHKITKARSYNDPGWDYSWKDTHLGDLHLDGTFFEPVDILGNVYNRLVIFDGANIHSASKYFGQIDSNARLWHMFFFD